MKISHFIAGGAAFWVGELAEHFAGGMGVAILVAGATASVVMLGAKALESIKS